MARYKNQGQGKRGGDLKQTVALPSYKLDSNLVLLPGIIYNVSFSRFKAAALLSRYARKVASVPLINNLINEYEFNQTDDNGDVVDASDSTTSISEEATEGIRSFYQFEQQLKLGFVDGSGEKVGGGSGSGSSVGSSFNPGNEFDWLVLAVYPNGGKIKFPDNEGKPVNDGVATVSRIVGIVDDTTNIKITLQALTRGSRVPGRRSRQPNEGYFEIRWGSELENVLQEFEKLHEGVGQLFRFIDTFILDYRRALNVETKLKNLSSREKGDLLTLNPVANALYLHLAGSKDFTKAYINLQKLFGTFSVSSKIDDKTLLRLLDLTCAIIPFPNHEKLILLSKIDPTTRICEFERMNERMISVFKNLQENNHFVNHWFYGEATNIQKANLVANQLKSIRLVLEGLTNGKGRGMNNRPGQNGRQLIRQGPNGSNKAARPKEGGEHDDGLEDAEDDDDDELRVITNFVKSKLPNISSISADSKRLIVKDFKRIKNSPPGNSDFHVIRNYLETVVDIPWDKYVTRFKSNKDIDLTFAKKQLDDDHYGLEHVKRRLIQYLVVLKLLGINADVEYKKLEFENSKKNNLSNKNGRNPIDGKSDAAAAKDDESIIIANDDETSIAHERARNKIKKSKDITKIGGQTAINESLSVSKHNKSPIIMLAGPPGTGKTSLAKSIATALGRNFQRISLGGVKDESEIRGHRRTYVGAMPGVIIQALRKSRSMNPVILLDEIDKIVGGNNSVSKVNGDPSAALLEVLDPEQNNTFIDHYLGFPVDLSQVIFICTANEPHNLSRPLLDRLEMIDVGAYDYNEKLVIGKRYLLPRQIKRNGLPSDELIQIDRLVMEKIILDYTREAGVRNFERRLGSICRYKAVEYSENLDNPKLYNPKVEAEDLPKYLGIPYPSMSSEIFESPIASSKFGVVNGLSYNSDGSGSVLVFESTGFTHESKPGSSLNMTGRLGEVLMESAKIGLIFVKLIIYRDLLNVMKLGITENLVEKINNLEIHLHVPLGSIQKDGPSAGITMALSFLSLVLEKPVPLDVAMTGEITLRGLVLPIGGVKEKILGAHLSGIKRVIVPRENRKDLIEEYCKSINDFSRLNGLLKDNDNKTGFKSCDPEDYWFNKYGIKLYYAKEFWDVIQVVWGDELLVKVEQARMVDYHI